jgi:hypothetical protein
MQMAEPVYIICSEAGSIDHITNVVSIFSVLDRIIFVQVKDAEEAKKLPAGGKPWLAIRMTSTWRRSDDEEGVAFDHQTTFSLPGEEQKRIISEGSFVFHGMLHRFVLDFGGPMINREGVIRVENRIRKLGDESWQEMAYEIRVEKMSLSEHPFKQD